MLYQLKCHKQTALWYCIPWSSVAFFFPSLNEITTYSMYLILIHYNMWSKKRWIRRRPSIVTSMMDCIFGWKMNAIIWWLKEESDLPVIVFSERYPVIGDNIGRVDQMINIHSQHVSFKNWSSAITNKTLQLPRMYSTTAIRCDSSCSSE